MATIGSRDSAAVLHELQELLAKDNPKDVFAYISQFAKGRANVSLLHPNDQATVLCDAAAGGNVVYLKKLLKQGVDPNTSDYDKRHALHLAAEEGQLECVKVLVEGGAFVNCEDRWGTTPLSGAIQNKYQDVVSYLKEHGAKAVNIRISDDGATALCNAAGKGDVGALNALLDQGISATAADYDFRSALHIAAEEGHLDCVRVLCEEGADLNCQDRWNTTPLSGAENNNNSEVALYLRGLGARRTGEMTLKRKGSSLRPSTKHDELIKAAASNNCEELKRLIDNGIDVDAGDYDNRCALHLAAEEGHMEAVKVLVAAGANLDVKDRWGTTPLRGAIRNTHNNIADYLKDCGAVTEKFVEQPSYQSHLRRTRNFFESMAGSIEFPRGDVLPLQVLINKLKFEFGMLVDGHQVLADEIEQLARKKDDPEVKKLITPACLEAFEHYEPTSARPEHVEAVFTFPDFADMVLGCLSEHVSLGRTHFEAPFNVLGTVVLDQLQIHNWDAFTSNLRAIFEEVLKTPNDGANADYIPELKNANSERFGVSVCTVNGQRFHLGDTEDTFSVQSVGKAFAYTLALRQHGGEQVHQHVGQEPSGRAFNDFTLTRKGNPFNPVTNAGAIVTCSMLNPEITDVEEKLKPYKQFLGDLSGGMEVGDCLDVYRSEQECAFRNYALANFMRAENTFPEHISSHERLAAAVEFYLRVCSSRVCTPLLANAAATYANYGINPLTGRSLMTETEVKQTLQILSSCGMYDFSGEWACTIGMPAKSGVSGEIFVVVPGVLGMCVWSPKLDAIGNSVRGIRLCKRFAEKFRFSVLDLLFRAKEQA